MLPTLRFHDTTSEVTRRERKSEEYERKTDRGTGRDRDGRRMGERKREFETFILNI